MISGQGKRRRQWATVGDDRRGRKTPTPVGRALGYLLLAVAPVAVFWTATFVLETSSFPGRLSEVPLVWEMRQTVVGHAAIAIAILLGMALIASEILFLNISQRAAYLGAAAVFIFVCAAAVDHVTSGIAAYSDRLIISRGPLATEAVPFADVNFVTFSCRGTRWHGKRGGPRRVLRYEFHLADARVLRLENSGVEPQIWLDVIRQIDSELSKVNVPRRPLNPSRLESCPGGWLRYFESGERAAIKTFIRAR